MARKLRWAGQSKTCNRARCRASRGSYTSNVGRGHDDRRANIDHRRFLFAVSSKTMRARMAPTVLAWATLSYRRKLRSHDSACEPDTTPGVEYRDCHLNGDRKEDGPCLPGICGSMDFISGWFVGA